MKLIPFSKKLKIFLSKKGGDLLPLALLFVLVLVFFIRLYFPPSIFTTPDFGLSDILHFNLPLKHILSENLRTFKIPLWDSSIGQGYPVFADGFTGTLYLPNLIIFTLLPLNLGMPTMYITIFVISAFGMFSLLKHLKLKNLPSILGAISYTFSACLILRVQHVNVLEANSLLPFVILFYLKFLKELNIKSLITCSILLSQLFFTGYLQIFVYTFLILLILGPLVLNNKKVLIKFILFFPLLLLITLILSSVQLLPMYELSTKTGRGSGLDPINILSGFPISYKNLLSFFNPFILGSASNGTYNSPQWDRVGIFWESTAYIGLIPFSMCLISILVFLRKPKKFTEYLPYLLIFILTLLLALGKISPLHVIYSFPPLNYFRVPARFLIFSQLFAAILASFMVNKLYRKLNNNLATLIVSILVIITVFDLWSKWWNYNPITAYKSIFNKPTITTYINNDKNNYRVYSLINALNWNEIFIKQGWNGKQKYYHFFLNSLAPNSNVLWGINNFSVYSSQEPRRNILQEQFIINDLKFQNSDNFKIGSIGTKILQQSSVRYLISPIPTINNDLIYIKQLTMEQFYYYLYELKDVQQRLKIYFDYAIVNNPTQYQTKISEIDPQKTVILEEDINKKFKSGKYTITDYSFSSNGVNIKYSSDEDGIFVINDSYYPGWKAKIDKMPTKIFPANINSRAIIIPKGKHSVNFYFSPSSFKLGVIISIIGYLAALLLLTRKSKNILKSFKPGITS